MGMHEEVGMASGRGSTGGENEKKIEKSDVPCSSPWMFFAISPNSTSSSALRTSVAEMLLCCFEVATSCALYSRQRNELQIQIHQTNIYVAAVQRI